MKEKRKPGRPIGTIRPNLTVTIAFRCTPDERAKAERIGNGNASEGVRLALEQAMEVQK